MNFHSNIKNAACVFRNNESLSVTFNNDRQNNTIGMLKEKNM